jgi:hypothetical protein
MNIVKVIWSKDEFHSKHMTPIKNIVNIYRKYKNINDPIYFLVLEGMSFYEDLKDELINLNAHIVDVSQLKKEYETSLSNIRNNLQDFLFNNLIRWLVMCRFFSNSNFLHLDCDLILNVDPKLIESKNQSIYMDSTCFVYLENSLTFGEMYFEQINYLNKNSNDFIDLMKNICKEEQHKWDQTKVKSIKDVHEELLFYWTLKAFSVNWVDKSKNILYIPFMQWLRSGRGLVEPLLEKGNQYDFIFRKHHINNIPLAYMHYQANFRIILSTYLAQREMGIPNKYKYCPTLFNFYSDINNLLFYNHKSEEEKFDRETCMNMFLSNIIAQVCENGITIRTKPHLRNGGVLIGSLDFLLNFEKIGLSEILNKDFWFCKNFFDN